MSLSRPTMSAIRFGYGIRPGEKLPDGPDDLLAQLRQPEADPVRYPIEGIEGRRETIRNHYKKARQARVDDRTQRRKNLQPLRKAVFTLCARDQHARMLQAALSPHGFRERLLTFWSDHFSINCRKGREMYLYAALYETEALRPNIAGSFKSLLKAAIIHPAMLTYLDQIRSNGPNSPRAKPARG